MSLSIHTPADADADAAPAPESLPSPGSHLRALREARKLDIERVAAQLHLQHAVVEAIEGDQYDALPAPVFVVGYLKNYARLLGADPTPILDAYRRLSPPRELTLTPALTPPDMPHSFGSSGRWIWLFGVVLLGVIIGAATLWIRAQTAAEQASDVLSLSTQTDAAANTAAASETETVQAAPPESIPLRNTPAPATAATETPALTPTAAAVPAPVETLVAATTLAKVPSQPAALVDEERDADQEDADPPDKKPAAETAAPPPTSTEVVLEFVGTSWVDVRAANGRVVLNGEMRSGDRRVLEGEPPYKFVIGNAAATQLTIGGRPFDLKRRAQGNVARFALDPKSFE
ncbi:cytoskeleton protein RodZ [Allochromatium warmingii]|uniref:Cytoskeleton protein RodZ n=1 Tax=Allochromatium warmingii TaxID=61595 RepID=A0A1H3CWS8_ALLWA|nr:RodZ domain-containing protein [Allochromatium warmingii]SDX58672.1 cytoskeleton protein RodZ [Allochromatium warmingii]